MTNNRINWFLRLFLIKSLSVYQLTLILLIVSSVISVGLIAAGWAISESHKVKNEISKLREIAIDKQAEKLKAEVSRLINYLEYIQQDTLHYSLKQIQDETLTYFEGMRFGNDGYVFVNTYDGVALLFDGNKLDTLKNISNLRDPNGLQIFQKELELAHLPDGGSFQYLFKKIYDTKLQPKISYIRGFDQWGWIVGAGDYLDNLDDEIALMEKELKSELYRAILTVLGIFIPVLFILLLISTFAAKSIQNQFNKFVRIIKNTELSKANKQPFKLIFIRELREIAYDIAHAEERIKQFGNIIEQSQNEIYIFGKDDLQFVHSNKGALQNCGYTLSEMYKMTFLDIKPELNKELFLDLVEPLKQKQTEKIQFESVHQRKNKTLYPIDVSITLSYFNNKEVYVAFIYDITDRKRAEEELNIANKIINRSPVVAFLWKNEEGWPVEFVSENIEILSGYSAIEFMNGKIAYSDIIHKKDLNKVDDEVAHYSKEEETKSFTHDPYRILTKTGEIKWVNDITFIRRDAEGLITHYEGIVYDISEQKTAAEKTELFSRIIEDSLNEIYLFDAATFNFTQVNSAAQQNIGYTMEELKKMTPLDFKPEFTFESFEKLVEPLKNGKETKIVFETVHQRKDQSLYDVEVHMQLLKQEQKELFTAIIIDITERKKDEKILREREAYSNALFEYAAVPIWVEDFSEVKKYFNKLKEKGVNDFSTYFHENMDEVKHIASLVEVSEINQKNLELYGATSKEELLSTLANWFNEESWLVFRDEQIALAEGKSQFESEISIVTPQGEIKQLILYLAVHPDHLDTLKIVFVSFIDITDRKNAEEELAKHRLHLEELINERTKALQETQDSLLNLVDDLNKQSTKLEKSNNAIAAINQELETFTYSVSHDLKAPLRGIDGYSQLLLDTYYDELNEEAREFLTNIRHSTQQMNNLIEDLLAYSRMERRDFRTENVQFKVLVDSLLLYYSKTISENKIAVKLNVPEDFKPVGDKDGLNLVMRNLLDNAIKFTSENKKIHIEIGGSESDTFWRIFVKDNGIGFDMQYHDRIFKIFHRLHLPEEYEGTGIGLAMVSKAMQRMNGKIWAESEVGKGACFYLEIRK